MIRDLKDFLSFNKSERLGILILLILIALMSVVYFISPYFVKPVFINDPVLIAGIDTLLTPDTLENKQPPAREDSLFKFDPNKIGIEEWVMLGLSKSQAEVVENYRKAGGKFYSKEDVKKMYTISDAMYEKIAPYILLEKTAVNNHQKAKPSSGKRTSTKQLSIIEINSADSASLTGLYGIGPVFASRIIAYRELLGGFYQKSQLLEVYGMDSNRLAGFISNIQIDSHKITGIDPLTADFKDVLRHPYISYELTKFIFNNKNRIKKDGLEYLLEFEQMNDSLFQKITPYLSID